MSDSHPLPEPLPEELGAMLAIEAEGEDLPDGFADRVRARLDATLGPGGGGPGGSPPPEGGTAPGSSATGSSGSTASSATASSATGSTGRWIASHAGTLVVGAALGAAAWAFLHPSPPPPPARVVVTPPPAPVAPVETVREAAPEPAPAPPSPPTAAPTTPTPRPSPRPAEPEPAPSDGRALLSRARAALGRRLPADALRALAEHRDAHPRSPLTEEREALTVQALAAAGRRARATQEAAIFRARYPRSIFLEGVAQAIEGLEEAPPE